jgi:hypothetical protein
MFCSECGTQVPNEAEFCHNCGARVVVPAEAPAPSPEPTASAEAAAGRTQIGRAQLAGHQPTARYAGASLVATTLWIIGWLIVLVGLVAAFAVAGSYECGDVFDECGKDEELGIRIGLWIGTVLISWLYAILFLWFSYVLRLLSDVEARLRIRGQPPVG